jgi:hypothetical protein
MTDVQYIPTPDPGQDNSISNSSETALPRRSTLAPSEKHLEDWICDNLPLFCNTYLDGTLSTVPYVTNVLKRQPRFPTGIPDLVVSMDHWRIGVVELKREVITPNAAIQCLRYMYDLRYIMAEVVEKRHSEAVSLYEAFNMMSYFIRGILVGHSLSDDFMLPGLEVANIEFVTYTYNGSGYSFLGTYWDGWEESHSNWADGALGDYLDECVNAWRVRNGN